MATQHSFGSHPNAFENSKLLHCLMGVFAARWIETAFHRMYMPAKHPMIGRNRFLIYSNEPQYNFFHNSQYAPFRLFCQSFSKKIQVHREMILPMNLLLFVTGDLSFGTPLELPFAPASETWTFGACHVPPTETVCRIICPTSNRPTYIVPFYHPFFFTFCHVVLSFLKNNQHVPLFVALPKKIKVLHMLNTIHLLTLLSIVFF